jgi:hypothetical protein
LPFCKGCTKVQCQALKFHTGQFAIETAFPYSLLEEELLMEIPDGYSKYLLEKYKESIDTKNTVLN